MLVLTRRDGETIMIGDDIEITVVECHRDAVRIGIDAPRTTKIRRGELLDPARIREPKEYKKARLDAAKKQREDQAGHSHQAASQTSLATRSTQSVDHHRGTEKK